MNRIYYLMTIALTLVACSTTKDKTKPQNLPTEVVMQESNTVSQVMPHVIIYKMKADYSNLVPVTMNSERTEITSYPSPKDINSNVSPVSLGNGWYLDRRGISVNTVFTDYTYEDYMSLQRAPSVSTLMQHITEKHPFTEIWDCGKEKRSIEQLQELISEGLPGCTCRYSE